MTIVSQSEADIMSIDNLLLRDIQDDESDVSGSYQWDGLPLTLSLSVEQMVDDLWRADFLLENVVESLLAQRLAISEFGYYFCKLSALLNAVALPHGYESNVHPDDGWLYFWIERLDLDGEEMRYASRQEAIDGVRELAQALCALDVGSVIDEIVRVQ